MPTPERLRAHHPSQRDPTGDLSFPLDALRAGAALLVLLSHVRDFTLRDAAAQPALSWAGRMVFAVSGLGHQAVIVFFVVSGYLVTCSMLRLDAAGRWSLRAFAIARLTRLWVVLAPCLILGAILDRIGLASIRTASEAAHYGVLALHGAANAPALDGLTVLGNLCFLQTILVPVYGSNGALWSLANEAWYYAGAALVFGAWRSRNNPAQALMLLGVALGVGAWLPWDIVRLAPVWVCGALCAWARPLSGRRGTGPWPHRVALSVVFASLVASRLRYGASQLLLDYATGASVAWLIGSVADGGPTKGRSADIVRFVSRLSYSLYLSHGPVLALLATLAIGPDKLVLDEAATLRMAGGFVLALIVATAIWWAFERHTPFLRRWIEQRSASWGLGRPTIAMPTERRPLSR